MPSFAVRKQPQLSLEELLHFRWLLGGSLALLSIGTLFYLEAAIWPVALLACAGIALSLMRPTLAAHIPAWLWRLGVPAIALFFAADLFLNDMFPAFVRLNALLVLHRAISYRTRREDLQLAALCLFLVIITGVVTASLLFAVQILLFTALTLVFLFIVNIVHAATEDQPVDPETWIHLSRGKLGRRLWSVIDLRLISLGAGLFVAVIVFAAVIFLSIPRFQMESVLNALLSNQSSSLSGFSERIALGEVTTIKQDHKIAMRVDVSGIDAAITVPYWRMVVLDAYDRGVFSVSRAMTAKIGARSVPMLDYTPHWAGPGPNVTLKTTEGAALTDAPAEPRSRYTVFLESGVSRFLPLPGTYRTLRFMEMQEIVANPYFDTLQTERQSATMLSFQLDDTNFSGVIPDPEFGTVNLRAPGIPLDQPDGGVARHHFLSYPATTLALPVSAAAHERLRTIVAEITGEKDLSAEEFARRACAWLALRHSYGLDITLPPASGIEDPVVRWLQSDTSGHCEFFAAAFILLSRTAGHPARAITGFKGGTWNTFENYYMVRNSDAHAWCEIFDGTGAWLRVDPTPGTSSVSTREEPIALGTVVTDDSVRAYLDSLRMVWYRRIVNFNQGSQREVAGKLRQLGRNAGRWSRGIAVGALGGFRAWLHRPLTLKNSGDLLFCALLLLIASALMKHFGVGTSDLFAWFRRGENPTRQRAGDMLRRVRLRLAEPHRRRRQFDIATARVLETQLCQIRFGRAETWPPVLAVFRAVRRLL